MRTSDTEILGAFVKLPSYLSVRPSFCLLGTTRLPLDGYSLNLIFEDFSEKSIENIQVVLKSDKNDEYFT